VRSLTPDESDLLARCVQRIPSAWEEFLARYRAVLERAARSTLLRAIGAVREDDLEAVVEATLLGIVKDDFASLRSFAGRSSLEGYLQAITTKVALNHLRTERRKGWLRFRPLDAAADVPAAEPQTTVDPQQLAALQKALEQLPPRDQLILKLFHLDGAGYKEIAALLGLSLNAVSPALIRARQKIHALLKGDR
jgi:RNA polymerase sigma-70 factor (ECF subfamily)